MNTSSAQIDKIEALHQQSVDLSSVSLSALSRAGDLEWDFSEDLLHRPRTVTKAKLRVDWRSYPFSPSLRGELQRIFALYYLAPRAVGAKRNMKPNSFCTNVCRTLDFLNAVVTRFPSTAMVKGIADIEVDDIRKTVKTYKGRSWQQIQRGLKVVFSPQSQKLLGVSFKINLADLRTIAFTYGEGGDHGETRVDQQYFPDELFTLLSDAATARVNDFLKRMQIHAEDVVSAEYSPPKSIVALTNFPETYGVYEQLRRMRKRVPISAVPEHVLRRRMAEVGAIASVMRDYVDEVNIAAQCVIALYTGARYSELSSFSLGCVDEIDGVPSIRGRVFKSKSDSLDTDDAWVAIPAVRDAVKVLEALTVLKNKKYLITSTQTANGQGLRGTGEPYSANGFCEALERLLKVVDDNRKFQSWRFSTHQFKHSLARQMVRAKLGLPYISFQLKHLHSRVASLPNDVTLGYGNAGKLLQLQSAGPIFEDVRRELAKKVYDPNSLVYGESAKEFMERRKAYFEGMTDAGVDRNEILNELADQGYLVNVGLGYCTGRKTDPATGEKPPCIGSLRCNPNKCSNAVVVKDVHGTGWKNVYVENRRMSQDPRFAYAKEELEAAAEEAADVLRRMNIEIEDV